MKLFILLAILIFSAHASQYSSSISPINTDIKKRMIQGKSWHKGCPVGLSSLRYLRIRHWNFQGHSTLGEMIVHKDIAHNVTEVFKHLYTIKYPIKQMRLVSDFKGKDWHSIEADNTSALNCRNVTGNKKKWSKHAYGKAIDINPIENPYISRTGYISHKASKPYRQRVHSPQKGTGYQAMLLPKSTAVTLFKKYGWQWGGDWKSIKDYQHFSIDIK
ncbi:MAG: M15 family metallopeptidase [Sulfurovum sp.]|nr:M15 family metallopeptidase [Sulfurovum sp.]